MRSEKPQICPCCARIVSASGVLSKCPPWRHNEGTDCCEIIGNVLREDLVFSLFTISFISFHELAVISWTRSRSCCRWCWSLDEAYKIAFDQSFWGYMSNLTWVSFFALFDSFNIFTISILPFPFPISFFSFSSLTCSLPFPFNKQCLFIFESMRYLCEMCVGVPFRCV